ncbi:mechanosensitive ion channel family protein [Phyllobacterium endophyticum]|uniref:mechanosensitive ion channel family protein n=1 Tax=Phyllobacterium endophyticum TaxID=1149773 RepID=UPI0011C851CB|nr:mechanosensitive ion channel family protein [Phyllobacterium endophyticum]TXR46335.1 mechanosensitive ion channel family protein [Phyllobacterium endophyticum]
MQIATTRDLIAKASVLLALSLALSWGSPSPAQTAAAPPPPAKVEELIKLLDDPEIKAWINTKGAPPPAAEESAVPSASDFMVWSNAVRAHLRGIGQAIPAVPAEFSKARALIMTEINGRRPAAVLLLFAAFAALGFGAEFVVRHIISRGGRMRASTTIEGSPARHHVIGRSMFTAIAPLVVFALASIGGFHVFTWPPLLAMLVLPMLVALIVLRLIMQITAILLNVHRHEIDGEKAAEVRLIPMDDLRAAFWYRRVAWFAGLFLTGWLADGMMTALNFAPNVKSLILYLLGLGLLTVALETVWNRPRALVAFRPYRVKEWLLTLYLCVLWLLWVAGMSLALWLGIYILILPPILKITSTIVQSLFTRPEDTHTTRNPVLEVLIERAARVVIIALAAAWLAAVVRLRTMGLMEDEAASRMIRGVLGGIIILLAADLIWHMARGLINQRIERARIDAGDEAALARSGRLMTLLPILRNFLAVAIAAIAGMMVLSGLGVAIGPLIAGAGIFGVAIGFGSQSLVKDIISGIFYMTDDAFRVGEYIQSGSYMGTVESFGIRSVKLRHHRGPIFTIPFGTLGAVQNMSRDWVIDKFFISVNFDADLVKVKKLVKGVGAALLEDEELGPQILETVKMKGVEAFSDYGIKLSFAVMTKPGHQSAIRRRAYAMIREAFALNGIGFASPTVQVAGGDDQATGAVAAASDEIARKKAAEAKLKLVEGES